MLFRLISFRTKCEAGCYISKKTSSALQLEKKSAGVDRSSANSEFYLALEEMSGDEVEYITRSGSNQYASAMLRAEVTQVHAPKHTDSINTNKVLKNFNYKYTD